MHIELNTSPLPLRPAGELPSFASQRLSSLDVSFNKFSGAVPDGLGAHPSLRSLEARGNQLTALPAAWMRAPGGEPVTAPLSYVRISANPSLEGGFPVGLAAYPNLAQLLLPQNRLRWVGWEGFGAGGPGGGRRAGGEGGLFAQLCLPTIS